MSAVHQTALAIFLTTVLSSGCCLTTSCGVAGGGCGAAGYGAPGCGIAHVESVGCDGACGGSCGSCGPVIPCAGGKSAGGCLGLGCIGKLFSIASYGCTGCASSGGGCGETYYHDWISDPPCANSCDGCSSCSGGGVFTEPGYIESAHVEPGCGAAGGGCDAAGCSSCRSAFSVPGRAMYSTWTGVGGFLHGFRRGFLPSCNNCNAFSFSHSCGSCEVAGSGVGYEAVAPGCGCGLASHGSPAGCSTCQSSVTAESYVDSGSSRLPHNVVTRQIRTAHNRPPHKVLSDRLR